MFVDMAVGACMHGLTENLNYFLSSLMEIIYSTTVTATYTNIGRDQLTLIILYLFLSQSYLPFRPCKHNMQAAASLLQKICIQLPIQLGRITH